MAVVHHALDIIRLDGVSDPRVRDVLTERSMRLTTAQLDILVDCGALEDCIDERLHQELDQELHEDLDPQDPSRDTAGDRVRAAIAEIAIQLVLGDGYRDMDRFTDSNLRVWLIAGNESSSTLLRAGLWLNDALDLIHMTGITAEPIAPAPNGQTPRCPMCGRSDGLASVEQLFGSARIVVEPGEYWGHDGYTEMNWDSSESTGWECDCGWSTPYPQWINQFGDR